MVIKPMIRSNICINAHPQGCAKETQRQIDYVKNQKELHKIKSAKDGGKGPKTVLVLGCSTGYGLASRITAAFEYGADTIGISFEKEASATKGGTPGWYNNMAFDHAAKKEGLISKTFNADAFSHDTRKLVIDEIKALGKKFDLIIYSLASPVRTDPDTKVLYKSVIKPQNKTYSGKAIDITSCTLKESSAEPAALNEIEETVKVMGGEDWKLWIEALLKADVIEEGCCTLAYSYIGPELSHAIYRDGTIGEAKKHLEKTAAELNNILNNSLKGSAYVSVNKGLVTRSSAVIPIISLYLSILFKVMKAAGTHEGCIEQMERLFTQRLYNENKEILTDEENRIRIDDWEMDENIQSEVKKYMDIVNDTNLSEICDLEGYKHDFLAANGFDVEGIDYNKDISGMDSIY